MRKVLIVILVLGLVQLFFIVNMAHAQSHPLIIVTESDYPELRARASQSPWKEMKADAIDYINNHDYEYDPSDQGDNYIRDRYSSMSGIMSAGALAYILDPSNKISYKNKLKDAMSDWGKLFKDARDWTGHNGNYWLRSDWQSAYWHSVLALDVIYNDLTSSERSDLESKLDDVADWFHGQSNSSYCFGDYGLWAVYQGDQSRINSAKTGWRSEFLKLLSSDGVFTDGSGYAGASVNYRLPKMDFLHILEMSGEDTTWYSDPTVARFYEWFYGAGHAPFKRFIGFGDSNPHSTEAAGVSTYAASRFSAKAGSNASWFIDGKVPPGRLMFYIFTDWPLTTAKKPLSDIWPDGCAAFWEDNPSDRSLMGVLWNCMVDDGRGHMHKDVNALHLCAYGEHVLRNSGYNGWGDGDHGFSWDYIHDTAVSGNTVLIDGSDHVDKRGGGITEGFTTPLFDYARGYSKDALPNGKHRRNFCFVHPQDGRNGYWVLFDEVEADNSSDNVSVALHPNSDDYSTISGNLEYKWKMGPVTWSGHDVFLNIFLGTTPTSVNIRDGLLAGGGGGFVGKYIYSTYSADGDGKRNIVTILFPHDASHSKADMSRISEAGYTGVKVDHGSSITDIALKSSDTSEVTFNGVSFRSTASLYRLNSDSLSFYFVRGGRSFSDGATPRQGFASDTNVGVYVKDTVGKITSSGAEVTFYYPGITDVLVDGVSLILDSGSDWIKANVPSGTHNIEFVTVPIPRGTQAQ